MLIVYDNLVDGSGVTFLHSTEVGTMVAENVQSIQPSEFFRTSTTDPTWIEAVDVVATADVIAGVGIVATAHRNMLKETNDLDTTWSTTNLSIFSAPNDVAAPGTDRSWRLIDNGTSGEHSLAQDLTVAGDGIPVDPQDSDWDSNYFTTAYYVTRLSGSLDVRLRLIGPAGTDYAECSFYLGTGTKGTVNTNGNWGNASASIALVPTIQGSGTWYRITLTGECTGGTGTTLTSKIMLESSGSVSYSGASSEVQASGVTLENGQTASPFVETQTDQAAFAKVGSGVTTRSGWQHLVSQDLRSRDTFDHTVMLSTAAAFDTCRLSIFDPTGSQVDIGRMVVGNALDLSGHLINFSPNIEEVSGEARTRGAQRYRGQHPRSRTAEFTLEYLSREQAFGEVVAMYRALGRSTPGLFIADEYETTYPDEFTIYGFCEGGQVSRQHGNTWQTRFNVVEVT